MKKSGSSQMIQMTKEAMKAIAEAALAIAEAIARLFRLPFKLAGALFRRSSRGTPGAVSLDQAAGDAHVLAEGRQGIKQATENRIGSARNFRSLVRLRLTGREIEPELWGRVTPQQAHYIQSLDRSELEVLAEYRPSDIQRLIDGGLQIDGVRGFYGQPAFSSASVETVENEEVSEDPGALSPRF